MKEEQKQSEEAATDGSASFEQESGQLACDCVDDNLRTPDIDAMTEWLIDPGFEDQDHEQAEAADLGAPADGLQAAGSFWGLQPSAFNNNAIHDHVHECNR